MAKQTFDQVSAALWGLNTLDYHTNYILPRTGWDDSDIRGEAAYYAGVARGLRLGASQKSEQPILPQHGGQDQSRVRVDRHDYENMLRNPLHPDLGMHDSIDVAWEGHALREIAPSHGPDVPAASHSLPLHYSAYTNNNSGHGFPGKDSQWARLLKQMDQANNQRFANASASHDKTGHPAGAQQRTTSEKARVEAEKTPKIFRMPSAPDGKTPTVHDATNGGQPSQLPERHASPQLPAVRQTGKSILAPLFEYYNEYHAKEESDNDFASFKQEVSNEEGDFYEILEKWFEDEAAREGGWEFDI